jgi:hypothetical protein
MISAKESIVFSSIPSNTNTSLLSPKDYILLIQVVAWPVFWLLIVFIFRKQIRLLIRFIINQVEKGAAVEVAGVKLSPSKMVEKTSDLGEAIRQVGNPDRFKLLFKVQGESDGSFFRKSTKAMKVPGGCIIQVTNERKHPDGSWSVAESLTYAPGDIAIMGDIRSGSFLDYGNNPEAD